MLWRKFVNINLCSVVAEKKKLKNHLLPCGQMEWINEVKNFALPKLWQLEIQKYILQPQIILMLTLKALI